MKHMTPTSATLHIGLSFATVDFFVNQTLTAQRRFYLPQESFSSSLKKFWDEVGYPQQIQVSSRYLEKILDAKLGGTVAQIVTKGFETWCHLKQPISPNHFSFQSSRQEPLASQELIFGISERVDSQGKILEPVALSELEFINAKLKLMNVKRVCVNLLFSNINPENQNQVSHFFKENGFEVFAIDRQANLKDEAAAWRTNLMSSCLAGAFAEHLEEIQKSFAENPVQLSVLDEHGKGFEEDKNKIAGSLFSWVRLLKQKHSNQKFDGILFLGLENWSLIQPNSESSNWKSAWGPLEIQTPTFTKLSRQPTQELSINPHGTLEFSNTELGFEPGPMSFGRAHKITLFDVLQSQLQFSLPQIQASGCQRFQDNLGALMKHQKQSPTQSLKKMIDSLCDSALNDLALEMHFLPNSPKKILVTGFFAPLLSERLKKIYPGEFNKDSWVTVESLL